MSTSAADAATRAAAADIDDAPVVKFLQKILTDAINAGASDLHFEPFEKYYRIRFRVDGVLREVAQPPLRNQGKAGVAHQGDLPNSISSEKRVRKTVA